MKFTFTFAIFLSVMTTSFSQVFPNYEYSVDIIKKLNDTTNKDWQFPLISYSFIGEYSKTLELWSKKDKQGNPKSFSKKELSEYKPLNAIDFISKQATKEKLILINESHHIPLHRVFTMELLQSLYQSGFRYLGLETLSNRLDDIDTLLNKRKYPIVKTGVFSREPQFGNLIREALRLGFYIFPYESTGKDFENRELQQAQNINNILIKDPNAKILIHCGYGHIIEDTGNDNFVFMAKHLKKLSGIDPLTINQVLLTEKNGGGDEHPNYRKFLLSESSVFVNSNGEALNEKSKYFHLQDILVYHPPTVFLNNRPKWLYRNGKWLAYNIPIKKIHIEYPVLASVYLRTDKINEKSSLNENSQPIPIDLLEITSQRELRPFVLPKGKYLMKVENISGQKQVILF